MKQILYKLFEHQHPVDEVHVKNTPAAEHHFGARCSASVAGMACRIAGAHVCLGFGYAAYDTFRRNVYVYAEQSRSQFQGRAGVEKIFGQWCSGRFTWHGYLCSLVLCVRVSL